MSEIVGNQTIVLIGYALIGVGLGLFGAYIRILSKRGGKEKAEKIREPQSHESQSIPPSIQLTPQTLQQLLQAMIQISAQRVEGDCEDKRGRGRPREPCEFEDECVFRSKTFLKKHGYEKTQNNEVALPESTAQQTIQETTQPTQSNDALSEALARMVEKVARKA